MTKKINRVNLQRASEIASLKATALEISCKIEDKEYQNFPDLLPRDFFKLVNMIMEMDDISFSDIAS